MVNMGLALKELLPDQGEANFSIVNFNALPEVYLPEHFSILRVLAPIGIVVGIGLIIFGVILIQGNRAAIEKLQDEVTLAEVQVTQEQKAIATLNAQIGPTEAIAGELNTMLIVMERGRATIHEDFTEIVKLATAKVTLSSVNHYGSSVTVGGAASDEDDIFSYARDLRNSGRFSQVWLSSVLKSGAGFSFVCSLTK